MVFNSCMYINKANRKKGAPSAPLAPPHAGGLFYLFHGMEMCPTAENPEKCLPTEKYVLALVQLVHLVHPFSG